MKKFSCLVSAALMLVSASAFASDPAYTLELRVRDANGMVAEETFDATAWLDAFPATNDPRGTISKTFTVQGEAEVKVGYYRGSSEANPEKAGHRLNIFDLSVRSADGSKSYCYNSIYVADLRETPYIRQTCPIGNGKTVTLIYSSKKFW